MNKKRNKRFANKTVLVTGSGRGMGREISCLFAKEGANLVLTDIDITTLHNVGDQIEGINGGGGYLCCKCDSASLEEVNTTVAEALSKFTKIDVLVNNAGIATTTSPMEEIEYEEWQKIINVNLNGVFYFMKAVLPRMREEKYGKIINVSSTAGKAVSTFAGAHYTTSKAGVLGITRHAAKEYAPFNININAIAPGTILTELLHEHATPQRLDEEAKKLPIRRLGTTTDIANLVAFLASDESSFITGATIDINGGELII